MELLMLVVVLALLLIFLTQPKKHLPEKWPEEEGEGEEEEA